MTPDGRNEGSRKDVGNDSGSDAGRSEPYLWRGPDPPPTNSGRKLVIGAFIFLVLLVVAVVVPLVVIGLHNSGVKPPPPGPSPTVSVPISTP
jgi:hypothetical protein